MSHFRGDHYVKIWRGSEVVFIDAFGNKFATGVGLNEIGVSWALKAFGNSYRDQGWSVELSTGHFSS